MGRDRSKDAVQGNFEELFNSLKSEGLTLEAAYEYLPKAIKAHSPPVGLIKNTYKKHRAKLTMPEKEFEESWLKNIADKASAAFFEVFPVEVKVEETDPIIYGSMTAKEYKAQRKHADQYPILDIEEMQRRLQANAYDPMQDLETLLGKDGNTK